MYSEGEIDTLYVGHHLSVYAVSLLLMKAKACEPYLLTYCW